MKPARVDETTPLQWPFVPDPVVRGLQLPIAATAASGHNGVCEESWRRHPLESLRSPLQHLRSGAALQRHRPGGAPLDEDRPASTPCTVFEEGQVPGPPEGTRPALGIQGRGSPRSLAAPVWKSARHRPRPGHSEYRAVGRTRPCLPARRSLGGLFRRWPSHGRTDRPGCPDRRLRLPRNSSKPIGGLRFCPPFEETAEGEDPRTGGRSLRRQAACPVWGSGLSEETPRLGGTPSVDLRLPERTFLILPDPRKTARPAYGMVRMRAGESSLG